MTTILDEIIAHKKTEIINLDLDMSKILDAEIPKSEKSFYQALLADNKKNIKIIAEIKKASPSKGELFMNADILKIAKIYQKNGASCISVLSDKKYFSGSLEDVQKVANFVQIPIIRKDFILEKTQIKQARLFGANAVLLMVSILKDIKILQEFREYAEFFGMDCLVETHDEESIKIAVASGAKIIGVNSRDFTDLSVNLNKLPNLLDQIPNNKNIVKVAESGIYTPEDVQLVMPHADAILVGTALMTSGIEKIKNQLQTLLI